MPPAFNSLSGYSLPLSNSPLGLGPGIDPDRPASPRRLARMLAASSSRCQARRLSGIDRLRPISSSLRFVAVSCSADQCLDPVAALSIDAGEEDDEE